MDLTQVTPKHVLLGGAMGALIAYAVIRSMTSLGPAQTALLIVILRIIMTYGIELSGLSRVDEAPFAQHKLVETAIAVGDIVVFEK